VQYINGDKETIDFVKLIDNIHLDYDVRIALQFPGLFEYALFCIKIYHKNYFKLLNVKEQITILQKERNAGFESINDSSIKEAIAVVGQKHCGSTMVFNIIRMAYKKMGERINDGPTTSLEDVDVYIAKSHDVDMFEECNKIIKYITTCRDVRDCSISSFFRFYFNQSVNKKENIRKEILKCGLNFFLNSMYENILLYEKSLKKNPHVFVYEKYKQNPVAEIKKLLIFLNIHDKISDKDLSEIIQSAESYFEKENLLKDLKGYQLNTDKTFDILLTKDHNTSGGQTRKWKSFFDPEQLDIIMADPIIVNYLKEFHYE